MREEAFLNAGLRITIEDKRLESEEKPESERRESMCYEGGIREFVTWLNKKKEPLHNNVIHMSDMKGDSFAELALQYDDGYQENILSFANNVHTPEGFSSLSRRLSSIVMRRPAFKNASSRMRVCSVS